MTTTALALTTAQGLTVAPGSPEFQQTAAHMAREYTEATAAIARLMVALEEQTARLHAAFTPDSGSDYNAFDLRFSFDSDHYIKAEDAPKLVAKMNRRAWQALANRLGIRNVMSVAKRKEFEHQLQQGDLPEITEDTIVGILLGLAGQAKDFATEAAREVFDILRPRKGWGGEYKTNDAFRVGRKVILVYRVERCWDGKKFRPNYHREQELTAIDGVFHLLDGQGVMREHRGPLVQAIEAAPEGKGETTYFRFKCFKNGNLHLEMKRLDLVKELNRLAAGEYVLGDDLD
jgi:hypothetical protein